MIGFTGLSHLGILSSIAAASKGFYVVAHDPDAALCDALSRGQFPFFEPGLAELLAAARPWIRFTADARELSTCQVIYFAQDVPTDHDNQSDLSAFPGRIEEVARHASAGATLVVLSQVPPGFTRRIASRLDRADLTVCYQVETLIFGRAVERALHPERFIVGSPDSSPPLPEAYAAFLAAFGCPVLPMRYESAELAKISINICLASSVSVANTLAGLCEAIGADWSEIVPALKLDRRIGPHAYLSPGLGIAGGNLERDLLTVCNLAAEHGTDARVIDAYLADSRHRRDWVLRLIHREAARHGPLTVAMWGLAYKADTTSTKNSPALVLLEALRTAPQPRSASDGTTQARTQARSASDGTVPAVPSLALRACEGFSVRAYDPQVRLDTTRFPHVVTTNSALEACRGADVLAVMTPWAEFAQIDLAQVASAMRGRLLIDPFALLADRGCVELGFHYRRLGTSSTRRRVA
jgi:UDPglucose 6-dehydrogenase